MKAKMLVQQIIPNADGTVLALIRNDDARFKLGDWFGGQEVLKIEMYGMEIDECSPGDTAGVTLSGHPGMVIEATCQETVDMIKMYRKAKV